MKKNIWFLLLAFTMLPVSAWTDESDPIFENDSIKKNYKGDEVVIVAFKSNDNLEVQPISASQLSRQMISSYNIQGMKEISGVIPNFFMPDYGSKMTSPVYIRGIGTRTNAPAVGLYVDGVPYFDRSSFDFDVDGIERIEILRGPQGSIYGRNTMGGVINVYTKSPFSPRRTTLGASLASYDSYKFRASHANNINETFGYSFAGNYTHNGGYFKNITRNQKADEMDMVSGRMRLGWQINQKLKAYLSSVYEYADQDGYPYGAYNEDNNTINDIDYNARSFYRRNMSNNGLTIEYQAPHFLLSSQSSFQYFDGVQGIDQDFTSKELYYVKFNHRQRMYSQEFNLKSTSKSWYNWVVGAFGFYQDYSQTNDISYFAQNMRKITDVVNPTKGAAVYHQSTFNNLLNENLSLTVGLRYDWEQTKANSNSRAIVNDVTKNDPEVIGKNTYRQFTPKVALQYNFSDLDMFYVSATRGYKAGGVNGTAEVDKGDNLTFDPEYNWNYEVGTKFGLFNQLIRTEISVFYIDWTDQQTTHTKASKQGFIIKNAGKSVSKGVEVTSHIAPAKNLNFHVSYGYTNAKFKEYEYNGGNYSGNYFPLVPSNTLSLAGDYTLPVKLSWLDNVKFNLQYTGVGSIYWNEKNTSKQPFYNILNGKISFNQKNVSVDVWVKNMTDEKYITYYFESSGKYAQRGRPFTIGVDLNVKF